MQSTFLHVAILTRSVSSRPTYRLLPEWRLDILLAFHRSITKRYTETDFVRNKFRHDLK
jgi:hypothetical protein